MDIRAKLVAAIEASDLPDRKLSFLATGTPDAVRNLRRGTTPRADTLERLCHAMGLELQISPAPKPPTNKPSTPAPASPTTFSANRELPIYEWTESPSDGYLRQSREPSCAPAPSDVSDEQAFYVRMPDDSMAPTEISEGDYCLVSPFERIRVDQRVWIRTRPGPETIKWVLRLTPDGFDLGAWDPGETHHPAPVASFWKREDIVERGTIVAVYREQPTAENLLEPRADWRPDLFADLWRSAQFSVAVKAQMDQLDQVVASVRNLQAELKRLTGTGEMSESQSGQVLRALTSMIDEGRKSVTDGASTPNNPDRAMPTRNSLDSRPD